jgi:hypothetical protein
MADLKMPRRRPQIGLRWSGLVWPVLGMVYIVFAGLYVSQIGLFDYMAADYRVFRASAEIAWQRGFDQVYDLGVQDEFQQPLYTRYAQGAGRANYAVIPMPYPPPFILLFLPLLLLPPVGGFIAWTLLNAALMVFYLWRLQRALPGNGTGALLPAALLCYPLFLNLFLGQVNVWLLICLGEFTLASLRHQDLRAGLWLGGLLIKPQALLLLLPGLLLGRRFKTLAGFTAAGAVLLALSLTLAGIPGVENLVRLVLLYPGELATTVPQLMMNWRSLAINVQPVLPGPVAWGLAIVGIVLTTGAALAPWLRPAELEGDRLLLTVLGTYAATCAVAWHAHIHMALPLAAPLLLLAGRGRLPRLLLPVWAVGPALVFFLTMFFTTRAPNLAGLATLGVNLYLVVWALIALRRPDPADPAFSGQAT